MVLYPFPMLQHPRIERSSHLQKKQTNKQKQQKPRNSKHKNEKIIGRACWICHYVQIFFPMEIYPRMV